MAPGEPPCRSSPDVESACPRDVSLRRRLPRIFRPLPGSGPSRSGSSQRQGLDGTASGARRNCRYDHRRRLCRFLRVGTHRQGIPAWCVEPSFRLGGILCIEVCGPNLQEGLVAPPRDQRHSTGATRTGPLIPFSRTVLAPAAAGPSSVVTLARISSGSARAAIRAA